MADESKAAFGIYPKALKRKEKYNDREAAANAPLAAIRGWTAGTLGLPGDFESIVRMLPGLEEKTYLPTSEYFDEHLPMRDMSPTGRAFSALGSASGGAGVGTLAKAGKKVATSGARLAGQAMSDALIHQTGPLASGPLSALAPRMAMTNVVKPKGGNWLTGSVENMVKPLKSKVTTENFVNYTPEQVEQMVGSDRIKRNDAINNWIDSNLSGYIKKEMGTPEDPVRALLEKRTQDIETQYAKEMQKVERLQQRAQSEADPRRAANLMRESERIAEDAASERDLLMEHVAHFPSNEVNFFANTWVPESVAANRVKGGYPTFGMGESPTAKAWENMSDSAIYGNTAESYRAPLTPSEIRRGLGSLVDENPWLTKLPPETMVYHPEGLPADLGIDHVIDILKQDVASGRIRPEQLNKVSMADAVKRAAEFDLEQARKMRETVLQQQEGFPLHKEYPEGYKWIELAPKEVKSKEDLGDLGMQAYFDYMKSGGDEAYALKAGQKADAQKYLAEALKYEGDTMGHCVGGYCPDVLEGRSRIFSLRDKRGEPHVTVEVNPGGYRDVYRGLPLDERGKINSMVEDWTSNIDYRPSPEDIEAKTEQIMSQMGYKPSESIKQIKGKQNKAPKEEYLPYVQDFVRGGQWSDVGDIHNTGLRATKDIFNEAELQKLKDLGQADLPHIMSGEEIQNYHNMIVPEGQRLKYDAKGNIIGLEGAEGMKAGGSVMSKIKSVKLANNDPLKFGVGGSVLAALKEAAAAKAAKVISESDKALPLVLPRAKPKTNEQIQQMAERVARQMTGEHVTSGKAGDTKNLAGRSMQENERVKQLNYSLVPTGAAEQSSIYVPRKGEMHIAIPGDQTVSDAILESVGNIQGINSLQEGGSRYGLGKLKLAQPHFWASNEGPAQLLQNKITRLYEQYQPESVMGQHMAMGPISNNFALHFADANLRAIDPSIMTPEQMNKFDQIIADGFMKKNNKTGEYEHISFPDWPGIADPHAAYEAMKFDPEMRKWFNNRMKTPDVTKKLNLPNGLDIQWAISEPNLRNMEVNLTGNSVGEMVPFAQLTDDAAHNTYSKGIRGIAKGHLEQLGPITLTFPDASEYIAKTKRPQDFTGTLQKVFPHQLVDDQWLDEVGRYNELIKKYTGKAKGGAVEQLSDAAREHLAKLKELRDVFKPAADAWTQKQLEDANKYTDDIKPINKAEGGWINADDLILEETPL